MKNYKKNENGNVYEVEYIGTPYSIRILPIPGEEGRWGTGRVEVVENGERIIGGYTRMYPSYTSETFYPFEIDGQWYALYSADYTATRVAKLGETFEDWCGEEGSSNGFCPTEFYVPRYNKFEDSHTDGTPFTYYTFDNEYKAEELTSQFYGKELDKNVEQGNTSYGFLCGCIWGDDSSWKLRFIDLSGVPEKKLTITEKFGYWELPNTLKLSECIDLHESFEDTLPTRLTVIGTQHFKI